MKKLLLLLAAVGVAGGLVGGGAYWWVSRSGSLPAPVTQWVGQQIQTIANWYLNPKLQFDALDYQYPATVAVKNVRLRAADPANPARMITIFGADEMVLELARIPQHGQPITMQRIILRRPVFQAIAETPASPRLIGFSNLLKSSDQRTAQPEPPGVKLSQIFQMRLVQLVDGRIVYDPRVEGRPSMELDQIRMRMELEDSGGGWYAVRTSLDRPPTMELTLAGKLNLDTLAAENLALDLKANLAPGQEKYLPPDLQKLLNDHEVKGVLSASLAGSASFTDYKASTLHAQALLTDASISLGEYCFPIGRLSLTAELADRRLSISSLELAALQGQAALNGTVALNHTADADLSLRIRDMVLQDTLRKQATAAAPPKYAGRVNADLRMSAPLAAVIRKAAPTTQSIPETALPEDWGGGTLRIDEGRLVNVPALQPLANALAKAARLAGIGSGAAMNDRAEARFSFTGDAVRFTDIKLAGSYLALRGNGYVTLDQQLNLKLTGGPVEKVGNLFGDTVGDAVAKVTGALAAYHVTGTLQQPQVTVEVAGGIGKSIERVGDTVEKGAKKVGDAIKGLFD